MRQVRPLVAILVGAAAITLFIGQGTDNQVIFAVAFALYLVAFGPLGWRVLTQSDEEWADEPAPAHVPAVT